MPRSLILVGPMGAGKTTIGKALSERLHLPFKDIDHMVVESTGADIPWIFDVEGELGFRKREKHALQEALDGEPSVIATGGGIVTQEANRQLLKEAGGVVFLCATVAQQLSRTRKDKNRPLLQKGNPEEILTNLMAVREPWYREVADFVIETNRMKPKTVVNAIIEYWHRAATVA